MFYIKSLLIVVALVLLSIIHHGFAKTDYEIECEEVMYGKWYETESDDGRTNFVTSYEQLSLRKIHIEFIPPQGVVEGSAARQTRLLKRELFKGYFKDLYANNGIDFEYPMIFNIHDWCVQAVQEVIRQYFNTIPGEENNVPLCTKTIKEVFEIGNDTDNPDIFYKLYHHWNVQDFSNNPRIETVINFPLNFFRYYQQLTNFNRTQEGNFNTIEQFCGNYADIIVRNKHRLRENAQEHFS